MGTTPASQRRRFMGLVPLLAVVMIVGEFAFLGRLDMAHNAAIVQNWTNSFSFRSASISRSKRHVLQEQDEEDRRCREWLEAEDNVPYARNFDKEPVLVAGFDQSLLQPMLLNMKSFYLWRILILGMKFTNRMKMVAQRLRMLLLQIQRSV